MLSKRASICSEFDLIALSVQKSSLPADDSMGMDNTKCIFSQSIFTFFPLLRSRALVSAICSAFRDNTFAGRVFASITLAWVVTALPVILLPFLMKLLPPVKSSQSGFSRGMSFRSVWLEWTSSTVCT